MRRRDFLYLTSSTILFAPLLGCNDSKNTSPNFLPSVGTKFLFIGDSITGAMRDVRFEDKPNNIYGLGNGFVNNIGGQFLKAYPNKKLEFYNRGISGIKTPELVDRWENSCLDLEPDVITIMVGAVDYIQRVRRGYEGTVSSFHTSLEEMLILTQKVLPQSRIIVMEPYLLEVAPLISIEIKVGFLPYQTTVKALSKQYGTNYVETQKPLEDAAMQHSAAYWCSDGIHPSPAGVSLLSDLWKDGFYGL